MNEVKSKSKNNRRRSLTVSDQALRRLVKAPETVNQIYELAESLYLRDGEAAGRMSLADIERVNEYLRQAQKDIEAMKKQFLDLTIVEGSFHPEKIPVGF